MTTTQTMFVPLLATLTVALFAAVSADAEARGGRWAARGLGAAAGAAASGPALSQAELRQCLAVQDTIDALAPKIKESNSHIDADKQKLERAAEAIKQKRESLDRTSQKAVDSFNAGVRRQQKLVEEHKAKIASHNQQVTVLERNIAVFQESCAGRSYSERDMKAVLAEAPQSR